MTFKELYLQLSVCNKLHQDTGQVRYALDCLVRHLLETGWNGAVALGWQGKDIKVEAGIGTLYLSPSEKKWTPAITAKPPPPPLPADPAIAAARQAICETCPRYDSGRCQVAGCGCAGQGQPLVRFSKCPTGKWLE